MYRKILTAILLICISIKGFSQDNNIDVLHYKFHIGLNDINDTIKCVAEIKVKFLNPSYELSFDLGLQKENGKGMKVGKILGPSFKNSLAKDEKIRIFLSQEMKADDTATFIIPYEGVPADGLIISKTKYGRRSFFADNWPNRGHNWLPCHDVQWDKASVEFLVIAPNHYKVVANGIQVEDSSYLNGNSFTHWKEDVPIPTKVMAIGVADFEVNLSGVVNDSIPVYSWVYPEEKDKGFYDYAQASEILPFYINKIGPYGYKKLANVQSKTIFGGLENANTIFYSENSVHGDRKTESLLAHEIAHQWFGNMATEKSYGHLWLSEGFATYFTALYFENKYGKDTANYMLKEDREEVIDYSKYSTTPVVDTAEKDFMKLLNPNSYQKGGWVLHMLRRELGDSVFWKAIHKYYSIYFNGIADTEDLQKIFEDVSGKNLKIFFKQWLYTPGQPQLVIKWHYNVKKYELSFTITQKQKELFQFPLVIQMNFRSGNNQREKIMIDKKDTTFTFSVKEKPMDIIIDPEISLLYHGNLKEIK